MARHAAAVRRTRLRRVLEARRVPDRLEPRRGRPLARDAALRLVRRAQEPRRHRRGVPPPAPHARQAAPTSRDERAGPPAEVVVPDLRRLGYFVAVAEERNFTRAAERLHIAQPALSRQIQQLEETLGVQLFERNSRPLKLTETGKFFYSHAVQLLAQTAELESMTRRVGNIERSLSVGFVGSTLYGMLPKIIRRFRDENPTVELSLHEMSTMDQLRALKDGRIDV